MTVTHSPVNKVQKPKLIHTKCLTEEYKADDILTHSTRNKIQNLKIVLIYRLIKQ